MSTPPKAMPTRAVWFALLLAATLAGCAPIIVGGMVATGMTASDRRTAGTQLDDDRIESRSAGRLKDALGDQVHIDITSYNRQVLLTGEVGSDQDRQAAEQAVARVENVRNIVNELAVMGVTTLSQRSSDAVVSARVKGNLIDAKDLSANAFKVVTERGIVYLLGRVTMREADRATEIARRSSGVLKVVRLFEIVSEEDLLEMQAPTRSTGSSAGTAPAAAPPAAAASSSQ